MNNKKTQILTQDLNILKLAHQQRKIDTQIKTAPEIQNLIDDGEIKNVQIHENSISYEPDYEKKFNRLSGICIFLVMVLICILGFWIGLNYSAL